MRSRTLCAMVLPTTSSSVKNTANRIQRTMRPISPICLTKPRLKSFSVWVLVSSGEFSNIVSTVLLMASACLPSASFKMKKLARPLPNGVGLVKVVVVDEDVLGQLLGVLGRLPS